MVPKSGYISHSSFVKRLCRSGWHGSITTSTGLHIRAVHSGSGTDLGIVAALVVDVLDVESLETLSIEGSHGSVGAVNSRECDQGSIRAGSNKC